MGEGAPGLSGATCPAQLFTLDLKPDVVGERTRTLRDLGACRKEGDSGSLTQQAHFPKLCTP